MKQFIKFEAQYYMDEHPFHVVHAMNPEKAEDYIKYMNSVWSGGTYSQEYHVMAPDEALKHTIAVIKSEHDNPRDDSEEFIANILKELKECYGIDYKPLNN